MAALTHQLRRFPAALKALRLRRGVQQKAFAIDLGIGAAFLCGIEKGTRAPLDDGLLEQAGRLLELNTDEQAQLRSLAHHDRLVHQMELRGASDDELQLISSALTAWHHMSPQQRTDWLANVRQLADNVVQVSAMTRRRLTKEAAMG
ncbi:helix-turn-helix domain-containing protein [Roseateles flavus]|uniref:Helix-turn-helix transcriptional regulator n=1 Tax=Roseateles flavus TaxID=3149041 RepID=A0ABV0GKF9_9BURK